MIRALVVGMGSIGRRHLANIRATEPDAHITVLRHRTADTSLPKGADRIVHTLDEAIAEDPDVGFLCGPTALHVPVGTALLKAGIHAFVEKPLALEAAGAHQLVQTGLDSGRIVIVGYNLRYCASLRAVYEALRAGRIGRVMSGRAEVGQYLPDWRPGADYRITNSARADLGGGVVFELSHEIDYLCWLLGDVTAVQAVVARLGDYEIDADDTAELLLDFAGGSIGSIHMDMTQRNPTRRCQVIGTDGTLTWDGITGQTSLFVPDSGWTTLVAADSEERNAMYLAELAHVFACVRGEAVPFADAPTGARVVQLAQAAVVASRERRCIAV